MMSNRDGKGRFLPGHSVPGPGRPALSAELPLAEGVKAACSAEKVAQALDKLFEVGIQKANVQALGLWLSYAVGKPAENTVLDRMEAIEKLIRESMRQGQ